MQAIVLFGHGSRDALWHQPMEAVAGLIRAQSPQTLVACAYLELSSPDLRSAALALAQAGASRLAVLPMFLGLGRHVRHDLPLLMDALRAELPALPIVLLPPVGQNAQLLELMANLALQGAAHLPHDAALSP